jgi:hypothetical protein
MSERTTKSRDFSRASSFVTLPSMSTPAPQNPEKKEKKDKKSKNEINLPTGPKGGTPHQKMKQSVAEFEKNVDKRGQVAKKREPPLGVSSVVVGFLLVIVVGSGMILFIFLFLC